MPLYEYVCDNAHVTERRGGFEEVSAPCACGLTSRRREFNLAAIVGATVMKEQKYRVSEFQEASAEIDYHYTKAENNGMPVKRPDLYGEAKKRARAQGAQVR